ncbi:hypothetical protein P7F60_12085 [Rhizobium sp. YJ-22]|uniref:hypothetical protein n=1 Tax=Rhizobium sp. YJ-22 TaxID=3037556 RepID=UPI002412CBE4|nr:hypothetical protein [Rhizobium sp. YJ-22]MDG3577132.1 hypothetical protein [Rhizobium sp. YJ-22]
MSDELLRRRAAEARQMLDIPLFNEIWDEIERSATNACINADPADHDKRAAYAAEARAIKKFRSKLNFIVEEAKAVKNRPA